MTFLKSTDHVDNVRVMVLQALYELDSSGHSLDMVLTRLFSEQPIGKKANLIISTGCLSAKSIHKAIRTVTIKSSLMLRTVVPPHEAQ